MIDKELDRKFQIRHNIAMCVLFFIFIIGSTVYYIKNKNDAIKPMGCTSESHQLLSPCDLQEVVRPDHFDEAITVVLKHEGLLSNVKDDAGGLTNYGLSFRYLSELAKEDPVIAKELDRNHNKILDAYDVIHLPLDEAKEVYKREFWDKYKLNRIKYVKLAIKLLDVSVNMGPLEAHKLISRAYKNSFNKEFINYDNINLLTLSDNQLLLTQLCGEAANYYHEIANIHPTYQKFLKGWLNRASEGCGA